MKIIFALVLTGITLVVVSSCGPMFVGLPVGTHIAFMNFSTRYYAAFGLREHVESGDAVEFARTPLLPPGTVYRADFLEFIVNWCPQSLDFQLQLYRRVNDNQEPPIPIGLDQGEQVEPVPIVAGQIEDIPGTCAGLQPEGIYTIANWEAPEGIGRVKFAQDTEIDEMIRSSGRFPNDDAVWELAGATPELAAPAPAAMVMSRIAGHVTLANGTGVEGVGVLLRTRFRVRLDDDDPGNDPDSGFSDPIAFAITDASGAFAFNRPAGVYQLECFADDFAFAPSTVVVESPLETVSVLAESL